MKTFFVGLMILYVTMATASAQKLDAMPEGMLGVWASDPKNCSDENAENRIVIQPQRIKFGSPGDLRLSDIELVRGDLRAYGKRRYGTARTEELRFHISADGRLIFDRLGERGPRGSKASVMTYTRCPQAP